MIILSKQEAERMKRHIIEPITGMTEMDLFEWRHSCEDWQIV